MCGITGFCDFTSRSNDTILKDMTDTLVHRGPDDHGYQIFQDTNAIIGLGHRRLSILDLSPLGRQPMQTPDERYHIVFNGEIYNFAEIQQRLIKQYNIKFLSQSDTEVILHAYQRWGIESFHHFRGMFAFVIFDKQQKQLLLCRDRTGVKPLYYYWNNGCFLFSSELKSFHQHPGFTKKLDINGVHAYLKWGYIPAPHTIFENTFKLQPGHYLTLDITRQTLTDKQYWNSMDCYNQPILDISFEEALVELERLFIQSFGYRMVADVPVGVFLSGGFDSVAVTAILQKHQSERLKTFTIGFDEHTYNEAPDAKKIADYLGCDHTEYICTPKDALLIIPKLPDIYDEPFGDSSAIPTILVSEKARQNVTVALSADAGDELFAGYSKYQTAIKIWKTINQLTPTQKKLIDHCLRYIPFQTLQRLFSAYNLETRAQKIKQMLRSSHIVDFMNITSQLITDQDRQSMMLKETILLPTAFDNKQSDIYQTDLINLMLATDYQTYLPDDILVKVDRATMSVGLEGREPLLDHHILEFVARLPGHFKYSEEGPKHLLKTLVYQYCPKSFLNRPKKGFSVPLEGWFRNELKFYFLHYLDPSRLKKQGLFNDKFVVRLRDRYLKGHPENVQKLWQLLMFQMWMSRWMD
ncbi:MAG: Asparagine synthase (glutamine-hydrolyzing) [Candidatus Magnetoglobus multicellularis str. Araruama]|uniref:asparagine synthase (glutamine-hydrolyzing) n=1 Tax=Candidatus Magnetoglobus multicellularis str. Araruama TaxID=890399 RepID=A0A1V1PE25_9BACT|nr:MAG: Asparagine synthase (glutamine-hydrolyzing) [Candidatus Magnetoglobus multicellularis str. Araruama]